MENNELLKRAEDLCRRCERSAAVTNTLFLTPAESYRLSCWAKHRTDCTLLLHGGNTECERTAAFFLPDWMEPESFTPEEYIKAIHITAYFGTPGHRDYLGAILGMGVGREWVGDIWVNESEAYVFCFPSVERHLLSLDKVGRTTVKAESVELSAVPTPTRQAKSLNFSVMSLRLDAVVGGMFRLSRTEAARQITAGNVSINYEVSLKTDFGVKSGDIISLRGAGKGEVKEIGGESRKGRTFVTVSIYK